MDKRQLLISLFFLICGLVCLGNIIAGKAETYMWIATVLFLWASFGFFKRSRL
ncbi:MAG: hypothetical protein RR967_02600 [Anaerovoracaceae bacterium]